MSNDEPFFFPFLHSAYQECMNFAKIGDGPCHYHWNEICAGVRDSRPFNLHSEKWFEGYPVKSTLFFSGCQKHLRFSRAWHPFFFWFTISNPDFSQVATLGNLRWFCHPEKNGVDFTGYPSNHFEGCRLNRRLCLLHSYLNQSQINTVKCPISHCIFAVFFTLKKYL